MDPVLAKRRPVEDVRERRPDARRLPAVRAGEAPAAPVGEGILNYGRHWRRRDDGWIAIANGTARRRLSSTGERQEFVHLAGVEGSDFSTPDTELVLERRLTELFDEVRQQICRRCHQVAWRFAGKGERYVRHGCARAARERAARIAKDRRRAERTHQRWAKKLLAMPGPAPFAMLVIARHRRRPPGRAAQIAGDLACRWGVTIVWPKMPPHAAIAGDVWATAHDDVRAGDPVRALRHGELGCFPNRRSATWISHAYWMTDTKRGTVGKVRLGVALPLRKVPTRP